MTYASRFLVTAGNTREPIDRVRDWGNVFTGNTGYAIARAVAAFAAVDLLTSNAGHAAEAAQYGIAATLFRSHADLNRLLEERVPGGGYRGVFMTAAVADYTPERTYAVQERTVRGDGTEVWVVRDAQAGKVKSDYDRIAVLGRRTEKLVDRFRRDWAFTGLLVKFKLEVGRTDEELLAIAEKSRRASGADYLVANTLEMVEGGGPGESATRGAGAFLVGGETPVWVPRDGLAAACATLARGVTQ